MREIKFRVWYTAQNRMVTDCRLGEMDEEYEDYAIFMQYTGLKDDTKEQAEIYADSSIVEFEFLEELHKPVTLRGVFTFNDDELRYEIDISAKYDPYVCLSYDNIRMSNFKVIGTVQENKELL